MGIRLIEYSINDVTVFIQWPDIPYAIQKVFKSV